MSSIFCGFITRIICGLIILLCIGALMLGWHTRRLDALEKSYPITTNKLIRFTDVDGNAVYLHSDRIVGIEGTNFDDLPGYERYKGMTDVWLVDGSRRIVKEPPNLIAKAIGGEE